MKTGDSSKHFMAVVFIILVAALSRIIPHPDNVTPIGAMALFGGAYFSRKYFAFIIPILALFISDLVLNNTILRVFFPDHTGIVFFSQYMIWTYVAFAAIVGLGILFLKKITPVKLIGGSLLGSTIFFLISNFGAWLQFPMYPKSFSGLISAYAAALPFFRTSILGDLFFVLVLFGSYYLINKIVFQKQIAH